MEEDRPQQGGSKASVLDQYLDNPPDCTLWPEARIECPGCGRRGRLYCPDCLILIGKPDEVRVPTTLELPLQVDMVVTAEEQRRSSGVQVAVAAPQSVRVIAFDESEGSLPEYRPRTDLVVFPSEHSVCWTDMSPDELAAVRRVVLVDSRWVNAGVVVNHPKLRGLRHVRIRDPPAQSRFWRWHSEGEGHICTAEATYLVLKDFENASGVLTRGGALEDILFVFALVSSRIMHAYEKDPSKIGKALPASEEAKRRRRTRTVKLDRLVKAKYKGIQDVREREGEEAAMEEFCRRRREARRVYGGLNGSDNAPPPAARSAFTLDGTEHSVLDRRRG